MRTVLTLDVDGDQAQGGSTPGRPALSRDRQRDAAPRADQPAPFAQQAFKIGARGDLEPGLSLAKVAELIELLEGASLLMGVP